MSVVTVQIRLIAASRAEAEQAITALREAVGTARLAINTPRPGRHTDGSGHPRWLAYGTFQCTLVPPAIGTSYRPRRRPR